MYETVLDDIVWKLWGFKPKLKLVWRDTIRHSHTDKWNLSPLCHGPKSKTMSYEITFVETITPALFVVSQRTHWISVDTGPLTPRVLLYSLLMNGMYFVLCLRCYQPISLSFTPSLVGNGKKALYNDVRNCRNYQGRKEDLESRRMERRRGSPLTHENTQKAWECFRTSYQCFFVSNEKCFRKNHLPTQTKIFAFQNLKKIERNTINESKNVKLFRACGWLIFSLCQKRKKHCWCHLARKLPEVIGILKTTAIWGDEHLTLEDFKGTGLDLTSGLQSCVWILVYYRTVTQAKTLFQNPTFCRVLGLFYM